MSENQNRQPTAAEVEVLQILWRRGPQSVREVHELFAVGRDVKYTTTLKTMQVMHERGFVSRESQGRKHIYAAAVERERTQDGLLDTFLQRTFGGSAKALAMRALGKHRPNKTEIAELKALLNRLENEEQ